MVTRSAFLTGITGFIGGHLAERLLAEGWIVHALVREASNADAAPPSVVVHRSNGTIDALAAILSETRPDVVFHLASLYLADHKPDQVDALIASNVLLPARLAEAMTLAGVNRLVNAGTAWQHYDGDGYDPVNLYAATKQACVDLLRYFYEVRGLSLVTLKLFDTYGAGDKRRKLVQLLIDAARDGEALDMSPGEQVVDMTHVDDVANAFIGAADLLLAAPDAINGTYLISGERMTVRQLADMVGRVLGTAIATRFGARPYRAREVMRPVTVTADHMLPGWQPKRTIARSISELAHQEKAI